MASAVVFVLDGEWMQENQWNKIWANDSPPGPAAQATYLHTYIVWSQI